MPYNPPSNLWMVQVVRCKERINGAIAKANTKAASATKPTVLLNSDQSAPFHITASAIDYVTRSHTVAAEPLSILGSDTSNPIRHNTVVPDVLGHD